MSQKKFLRAGERIHIIERYMNNLEGVRSGDDTLPRRFLQEDRSVYPRKAAVPLNAERRLRVLTPKEYPESFDVDIRFKHLQAAMLLFTFREGTTEAFARDRMVVYGNLPEALSIVRILNIVEVYLLPKFLAKRAVKSYPRWSFARKHSGRIAVYVKTEFGI